jgi:hypothetical protein
MMIRRRFHWLPLTLGLVLGLAGGLSYAWLVDPVDYVDVAPHQLNPDDQAAYVLMVSLAYAQDGDLARARGRIEALNVPDPAQAVSEQADLAMSEGEAAADIRALTNLAVALGGQPRAAAIFAGTPVVPATPTPTLTPSPTTTPTPTPSPSAPEGPTPTVTPTPILSYELTARNEICSDDYPAGMLEVYVRTDEGQGMPGVEVLVQWADGQDRFFTGLRPELYPGYADFEMTPGEVYTVSLATLSQPVAGMAAETCYTESGTPSTITYQLVYVP